MKKFEIIVSRFAVSDLNEIVNYFETINSKYAISLYLKIKHRILELNTFPDRGRIVPELEKQGVHEFKELIEGNYRIIYSLHEFSVHILSVVDSRRNLEEILMKKIYEYFEE
jgi:toxin ParE1/3/4